MSAHRLRLAITERAADDLLRIQRHTLEQWGGDQASEYELAIHEALDLLCSHPGLGKTRDDLRPRLHSYPVLSHLVVDRVDGDMLIVLRIVHQRMDLHRALLS